MLLTNLRVIEIGQVLSAPYAGMIFAELGADVIKIEKPGGGDDARNMGAAFRHGASMNFLDYNRGKKSVVLDLKTEAGRADLFRLLETTDVLIHNLRPGDAEKLGLDGATLTARFPRLVYCEISAFGHKGPRKLKPGYEPLLQAFGGLVAMNGDESGPPARMGASLVDQGTALWTVIGALSALRRRDEAGPGGRGAIVNASLLETSLGWAAGRIHSELNEGKSSKRYGTAHPSLVPYQAFETADGLLMICAGNDRLFAKLAEALGHVEWTRDDRFATNRQRLIHREAIVARIEAVLRTATRARWMERIEAAGVPVAPVNTIAEVIADPQVKAMEILRPVPGEDYSLVGTPLSVDGARVGSGKAAPLLGEDNERVLGLSSAPSPASTPSPSSEGDER